MSQLPNQPYTQLGTLVVANQQTYDAGTIGGNFSQGESSATQVWNVDRNNISDFITDVLGWSSRAANGTIFRKIPGRHPWNFALYASRISNIQGISSQGQYQNIFGVDALWKTYRVTVQFDTPMYNILENEVISPGEEWQRYVVWNMTPRVEYIQRSQWMYRFDASSGLEPNDRTIPGVYGSMVRLVKKEIVGLWVQVPDDGLFPGGSTASLRSPNLDNGLGKVNDDFALGVYPPGTLRFDGYRPIPRVMPKPPGLGGEIPLAWDVEMHFNYFEPPYGGNASPVGDGTNYGHNLAPHPSYLEWYPVYSDPGGPGGAKPRYETYPFDDLWTLN